MDKDPVCGRTMDRNKAYVVLKFEKKNIFFAVLYVRLNLKRIQRNILT
jgi:hypothetical protein